MDNGASSHPNKFLATLSISAGVIPILVIVAAYITALKLGHLENNQEFPFILDFASRQPESSIFAIGFCLACLMHITVVYARYMQVLTFRNPACPKSNHACFYFGPLLAFGESILAAFRDFQCKWAFYFGKTLFFASLCIYIGIQAYIGIHTPEYHRKWLVYLRCFFTASSCVCPFLSIFGVSFAKLKQLGVPQATEMALLIISCIFWMTLAVDFRDNDIVFLFRYYEMQVQSKRQDVEKADCEDTNEIQETNGSDEDIRNDTNTSQNM